MNSINKNPSPRIAAKTIVAKAFAFCCALTVILLAHPATAADLAILRNGFSIRHDHRQVIGNTTRLFFSADDFSFTDVPTEEITGYEKDMSLPVPADSLASSPIPPPTAKSAPVLALNDVVNSASANYHLDPDLVNSVIHAESGFNAHALSPKGARGLMQLMPGTATQLGVNDAFNPQANVEGGSHYLRELLERYNFDLVKALAAYNAGPERVEHYQGVPPFRETRAYVARIVHEYNTKKIAQEKAAKLKQASVKALNKTPRTVHPVSKSVATTVAVSASH
ncbi:MAG: lytic transglycosylase domain-containing protein [Terriglobales bacterium]|jgi:soluble lytic murein transglycosylase-like protein